MTQSRHSDHPRQVIMLAVFAMMLWTAPLYGAPGAGEPSGTIQHAAVVQAAERAVDQAWEVYHQAALGGTLASPALQVDIEQHLHEARTLVVLVYELADADQAEQLEGLLRQIRVHASSAIASSQERKP